MGFIDAMKMAQRGSRVQRTSWGNVSWYVTAPTLYPDFIMHYGSIDREMRYTPSQEDVFAGDWELMR